jgi:predicted nucleotidyltransferase
VDNVIANIKKIFDASVSSGKLILYGSRARGTHKERSDYDIAYVIPDEEEKRKFLSQLLEPNFTLFKIDLLDYDVASEELKKSVDTEGCLIYEK